MKLILISIASILIILTVWKNHNKISTAPQINFISIASDKGSTDHLPVLSKGIFNKQELKYEKQEFNQYSNAYTDITNLICNDVYSSFKYWKKDMTHADFLNILSPEQRIYFTLVTFEAQVNNGGVYQFLFNNPDMAHIALESMEVLKMEKLKNDYRIVLNEYFGKFDNIEQLKSKFNNESSDWEKRWNSFAEGYKELKSAEVIESYFYETEFTKEFQNKMYNYARNGEGKLFRVN